MNHSPKSPSDPQPDWAQLLPREVFDEIILVLRAVLPPTDTDDPADERRRVNSAIEGVAALRPANAAEGRLAALFVVADAHALDCLRLARERQGEPKIALKCVAQGMSFMREAKSTLRVLLQLQAARQSGPVSNNETKSRNTRLKTEERPWPSLDGVIWGNAD